MAACSGMPPTREVSCGWRAPSIRSSTNGCAACTWIGSGSMVASTIDPEQYERLRSLHLDWIRFADESRRNYPRNTLAAHVMGAVDSEETGQWGLEKSLESDLRGLPGSVRVLTDAKGRGIDSHLETEPKPGADVTVSIDERIQLPAQDAI